jgi:hypothetical protein
MPTAANTYMLKRLFSIDSELRFTKATVTLTTRWLGRVGTQWIVLRCQSVARSSRS